MIIYAQKFLRILALFWRPGGFLINIPYCPCITLWYTPTWHIVYKCGALHIKVIWVNWSYYRKRVRISQGVPPRTHTEPLFSELNILKATNLYKYSIALFMYKLNCSKLPGIFPMFVLNHEIHKYETRQSDHFHIPTCRTNLSRMSIKYQGPIIWNEISSNIDIDCSIGTFKKRAKRYISGDHV